MIKSPDAYPEREAIQDGLDEHYSQDEAELQVEKQEHTEAITNEEKEELLANVETPEDVLALPRRFRMEGLDIVREKVGERYFALTEMQKIAEDVLRDFFGRPDGDFGWRTGTKGTRVQNEIKEKTRHLNLTDSDYDALYSALNEATRTISKTSECKNKEPDELLKFFIRDRDQLSEISGDYTVTVDPLAVSFDFERQEDFQRFVEMHEGQYKHTEGLSYERGAVPVIAQTGWNMENTRKHELQHSRFNIVVGRFAYRRGSEFDKAEVKTRNEILAETVGGGDMSKEFSRIMDDGYAQFSMHPDVDQEAYKKMLQLGIEKIEELQRLHIPNEDIVRLLQKERMSNWPRIVDRAKGSPSWKERRTKNKKTKRAQNIHRQRKADAAKADRVFSKMQEALTQGIDFSRKVNSDGTFYDKITKSDIVEALEGDRWYLLSDLKPEHIKLTRPIHAPGTYEVPIEIAHNVVTLSVRAFAV